MADNDLYLRQWLAGRDFARRDPVAGGMQNFVYGIGSLSRGECVLVDPAWDVAGIVEAAGADGMRVIGALATHYHPDHVGGDLWGHKVDGLSSFVGLVGAPTWVHEQEADGVRQMTGLEESDLKRVGSGDRLQIGAVGIRFLHTPGHTPGSQCFLVQDELLVAGDTLFVQGCGRVDLPGGDPEEMYRTLHQRLAKLPDTTVLYPGHAYGPTPTSTLGDERRTSHCFKVPDLASWLRMMGWG